MVTFLVKKNLGVNKTQVFYRKLVKTKQIKHGFFGVRSLSFTKN